MTLILGCGCAVIAEQEGLDIEDAARAEYLGSDIAAYLVGVIVEVELVADVDDFAVCYPVNGEGVFGSHGDGVGGVVNDDIRYLRGNGAVLDFILILLLAVLYLSGDIFNCLAQLAGNPRRLEAFDHTYLLIKLNKLVIVADILARRKELTALKALFERR